MHSIKTARTKLLSMAAVMMGCATQVTADDVTGDSFTVTVYQGTIARATATGFAGSAGHDILIDDYVNLELNWFDGNTFELDFYTLSGALVDLRIVISDLDFTDSSLPSRIADVTEVSSDFDLPYTLDVDDTSITLTYGTLDTFQSADGEVIVYDVDAVPYDGMTGDTFGLSVYESGMLQNQVTGVAGSAGPDIDTSVFMNTELEWIDESTFELFFYGGGALTNLVFDITDLDYKQNGSVVPIVDIEQLYADFGWAYSKTISGDSITLDYGNLDEVQSADGEVIRFRVVTGQPCLADVNMDGSLTPTDFTAWIAAFNSSIQACDQNGDGVCTPTDFTAWIANYNSGC